MSHIQISTQAKETRHLRHRAQSREEMKALILFLFRQRDHMTLEAGGTALHDASGFNGMADLTNLILNLMYV